MKTLFQILSAIKTIAAYAVFTLLCGNLHAQSSDAKRDWAVRAITAQEGAEMTRLYQQLAGTAIQPLIADWNERLAKLPEAKQQNALKAMDAELKKFGDDAVKAITAQATKVRSSALINAYTERFSEEELKQLAALLEAPVFKKYQGLAPDLGNVYVKAIVEGTRERIGERTAAFEAAAEKIITAAAKK